MPTQKNFFVITGGPASGKTTLIEALKQKGYYCVDEVARTILKEHEARGENIIAFRNTSQFAEAELQRSIAGYIRAQQESADALTFFDRGIPDIVAHARLKNMPVSPALDAAARTYRYNSIVFIAPPWRDIYRTDEERTESYEDAVRIFHLDAATYRAYGYTLVELPRDSVENRAQFVLEYCTTLKIY